MKFKRILSVALSAAMLVGSSSVAVSAKETEKKYDYVALGDSIAAGFGLENGGDITTDRAVCVTEELLADPIKDAYATVFGTYLEEMGETHGYSTTATNLSATGYRANDVAQTITTEGFMGDVAIGILEGFLGPGGSAPLKNYHEIFNKYLKEAELVSIQLGGNDIILELLIPMLSQENPLVSLIGGTVLTILAGFDSDAALKNALQSLKENLENMDYQTIKEAADYIKNVAENFDQYITNSANNVKKVVEAVRTINDTADIALIGMFDAYGNSLELNGQVKDIPNVVKSIFNRAISEIYGKGFDNKEKVAALSAIVSDEVAYPMQYLLVGKNIAPAMKSLNQKLNAVAEETGCIFVDVYDISNECNFDPHPLAQGHHDIADIMKTELSDTIIAKMTEKTIPQAERVVLSKKTATMTVGTTCQLRAVVAPYNASQSVKWSSSNSKIATVDSRGVITAKKAGTVTIKAVSENGKTAECKVTVKRKPSVLQMLLKSMVKK